MARFDPRVIPKCYDRMDKAKEALFRCRSATTAVEFSSYWASFLIHTGGVLNALDTGANATPQARQWYAGVKRAGRNDELVSYMHQARNSEEHGPDAATTAARPFPSIGAKNPKTGHIDWNMGTDWGSGRTGPDGSIEYDYRPPESGSTIVIGLNAGGQPALRPVTDHRYQKTFRPPTSHLGKPLEDSHPLRVGDLYLIYLESLVKQAETMAS
jgi:hypothetical protein